MEEEKISQATGWGGALTLLVGDRKDRHLAHKKSVPFIPKCSFQEQGEEENKGWPLNPGSPGK